MKAALCTKTETAVENLRESSASAKKIIGRVEESDIVPEVQRTMQNLQQITQQVKDAVDKFQAGSGEGGVGENLQRVLADAHETMSLVSFSAAEGPPSRWLHIP